MSDSPPPPSLNAPEWELRRRNAQSLSQDHAEPATPPTPTAAADSWQAQLAETRRAMAAKLEQQAQEDDERARASAEGLGESAATGRRDEEASEGSHRRRVSVASSEGDDELVEQLLRPRSTPTAAPVQEDEARQADADDESAEPAPQGPPPPQDDRVCRICFAGADDEEELGRLFSPCVCRGTVRVPPLRPARDLRRILTLLTRPSEPTCAHQMSRELAQDGGQPASVLPMLDVPLPVPVPSHYVGASHHQPACVHSRPVSTRWIS